MSNHQLFENLKHVATAIATQFGATCEVVVHDLTHPENSVIFIAGDVTGRSVGAPVTDFVLKLLASSEIPEDVVNYLSKTRDGRTLKSSTVFVRDNNNNPIGVFCINFDISNLLQVEDHLSGLVSPSITTHVHKSFSTDLPDLLEDMLRKPIERVLGTIENVDEIDKDKRLQVVGELEDQGFFKIRNSVPTIAEIFKVSRYTIYNDLKTLREVEKEESNRPFAGIQIEK